MDQKQLTHLAISFLKEKYSLELNVPIKINNRLKVALGQFICNRNGAECIDISGNLIKYGTEHVIIDTLYHELVHYALYTLEKPYHDGQRYFEDELHKHGIGGTNEIFVGRFMEYECPKCKQRYNTELLKVIREPESYNTRCCKVKIKPTRFITHTGEGTLEQLIAN